MKKQLDLGNVKVIIGYDADDYQTYTIDSDDYVTIGGALEDLGKVFERHVLGHALDLSGEDTDEE